jgi:hypothetical protein
MTPFRNLKKLAWGAAIVPAVLAGCTTDGSGTSSASVSAPTATLAATGQIVGMRRLTETQYRNTIADIFGPSIKVAGRFEPIVRPAHELIAMGAREAAISPAGLAQFDAIARNIAGEALQEANRELFMPCAPKDATKVDAACAGQAISTVGRYLFRRPLTKAEQSFYVGQAAAAVGPTKSFYKGLELALAAMLTSPNFLYVVETAKPGSDGAMELDAFAKASRLSYLLWNTTPNETLLRAAETGKLDDPAQFEAIAASMVKSPRFENGVRAFFADMLLFEKFDEIAKDPEIYPYFNQDVALALPEQMLRTVVDHLLVRNGDYRELFTTNRTFMNRALGAVYQVPVTQAYGWQPYEFKASDDRAGILGQAGFLALYAHSGRSSPTLRGRAVRELLMCQPVPDPPGNVNFTAVQETSNKAMPTARIRLTEHNTDAVCAGCHKITDPIGFALERFDGIGQFRMTENDTTIDVSSEVNGEAFAGASGLGKLVAGSPDTTMCLSTKALDYALGRKNEDEDLIERVDQKFAAANYSIRDLFLKIATMPEAYRVESKPIEGARTQVSLAK